MNEPSEALKTAFAHYRDGRLGKAIQIAEQTLAIWPDDAAALHLLGLAAFAAGQPKDAVSHYAKALLSAPSAADIHTDLAAAYLALGAAGDAAAHAGRAALLDPDLGEAHYNLGNALFALGDAAGAAGAYAAAIKTAPGNDAFWSNHLFALNFSAAASPEEIFQRNRAWGEMVEAQIGGVRAAPPRFHDGPLRLAYYLPEFDSHVTPRFLEPVLRAHDLDKFRVCVYGSRVGVGRGTPAFVPDGVAWIDVGGVPDAKLAERMRADGIDILIHPCTFKARYRRILGQHAAPVQMAAINLVSTTGLSTTDYLLTDAHLDPPDASEQFYTEELIRLPAFNTYRIPEAAPPVGPLPALTNGFVTFGSFNNPAKMTPGTISVWADILKAVPDSRLVLKHRALGDGNVAARFVTRFSGAGITPERIMLEGFTSDGAAYLDSYNRIDMALDPFPFGGGTTSYEALWMGVPVLTLQGKTFMGRLTAALMGRLDLSQWAASDAGEYVARAIGLAADLDGLAGLRAALRERARATIFDGEAFTRSLEAACLDVWRRIKENR
jgi:protein O-GlcNAc transferase